MLSRNAHTSAMWYLDIYIQDIYILRTNDILPKFIASINLPSWNYLCWKDTNHGTQPVASQRLPPRQQKPNQLLFESRLTRVSKKFYNRTYIE